MREIGRLRELTFRTVGEGCGQPRDIDRFDRHYEQLVLWDDRDLEIVGAYRLANAQKILAEENPQSKIAEHGESAVLIDRPGF